MVAEDSEAGGWRLMMLKQVDGGEAGGFVVGESIATDEYPHTETTRTTDELRLGLVLLVLESLDKQF